MSGPSDIDSGSLRQARRRAAGRADRGHMGKGTAPWHSARMSDQALRALLSRSVEQLRVATDLTTDEVIGLAALPEAMRTPEVDRKSVV